MLTDGGGVVSTTTRKQTWYVEYNCAYGRNGWQPITPTTCDTGWADEVDTPNAWGYCPSCGKRRAPITSHPAGEEVS